MEGFSTGDDRHIVFRNGGTIRLYPAGATNYYIDGDPPPLISNQSGALPKAPYVQIVGDALVRQENVEKSYSGLCLAGRVSGEAVSREMCASIRFSGESAQYFLSDLLTIHGWSAAALISRSTFYNARTERLDRDAPAPSLVVADGGESFLKVLSWQKFQRSDVIGVFHRAIDRERLEAVGGRLSGLRQWYVDDTEMLETLPLAPRGIRVSVLAKRAT